VFAFLRQSLAFPFLLKVSISCRITTLLTVNEFLIIYMMFRTLFNFQCPFSCSLSRFQAFSKPVSGDSFFILPPLLNLVKHFFNFFRVNFCTCFLAATDLYCSIFTSQCQLSILAICLSMRFSVNAAFI
jgi:hypothetical protein